MQYIYISDSSDGHLNLARDEWLLSSISPDDIILHLYINSNAVIIGRNQNPLMECNLDRMKADSVQLVRRISGGGAVYHDCGNLNYSFICSKNVYDEGRQNSVIVDTLKSLGIMCEVSGRNDMTVNGHKFSGNAFCGKGEMRQQHGTLLINSNLNVFDNYLTAPKQKLDSKGIKSVRARVCNLSEFVPDLTVEKMADSLTASFQKEYGTAESFASFDNKAVSELFAKHSGWEWLMGETPAFDYKFEQKFCWGMVHLLFSVEGGYIKKVSLFTDSLNVKLPELTKAVLCGERFDRALICKKLADRNDAFLYDIGQMINSQDI